jgi:myo-inositol-1(or 4)-monophosphatase
VNAGTADHVLAATLRDLACTLAVEAGRTVADGRAHGVRDAGTKSTATDMVTEFDRQSEQLIVDRLRGERPDDGLVGEEGASHQGTTGIGWLIDPIDGTTNFLYDLPGWAVSIAAIDGDGALAGAVYVPRTGELFAAARGQGATLDGRPIRCSDAATLATALVATGFGYDAGRRARQGARLATVLPQVRDVRRLGAASVDLCYVAAGRLDAYYEEGLGPWDYAAGELIAREAGCRSGDFADGPPSSRELVVAAPGVFASLRALLAATSAHSAWTD